jgi:hypothetical protein
LGSQNYSSKLSYLLTIKHDLDKNNKQCAFTVLLSLGLGFGRCSANEDQRSHQLLRRRVLNEQQVTLKVPSSKSVS